MKNCQEDEWERTVDVNCKGVMNGFGSVLTGMTERGVGHIITISSDAGRRVFPNLAVYCASKYFVEALSEVPSHFSHTPLLSLAFLSFFLSFFLAFFSLIFSLISHRGRAASSSGRAFGCENYEFCIKNEKLCIKNKILCIQKKMNFAGDHDPARRLRDGPRCHQHRYGGMCRHGCDPREAGRGGLG